MRPYRAALFVLLANIFQARAMFASRSHMVKNSEIYDNITEEAEIKETENGGNSTVNDVDYMST